MFVFPVPSILSPYIKTFSDSCDASRPKYPNTTCQTSWSISLRSLLAHFGLFALMELH